MSKSDTISVSAEELSKITDNIGAILGSLRGLSQLLECGETSHDRIGFMIEVFAKGLDSEFWKLDEIAHLREVAS